MTIFIVAVAILIVVTAWQFADQRSTSAASRDRQVGNPNRTEEPGGTSGEEKHTNRLIDETSPYLLQHAHNPVDWYAWGPEAFEKAERENKPIFLSVGYSTCHWCHVMAHESFEDEAVAEIMNEHYVAIKVDREERPDIDEQYMLATQLFTRRGGWPNSVWLTPDGRPWYAGTYYPKEQFQRVLLELSAAWKEQPDKIEQQARQFAQAIEQFGSGQQFKNDQPLSPDIVDAGVRETLVGYDQQHGGFGGSPKFPPHGALALLIHQQRASGDLQQMSVITHTLDAMRMGGVYDHVGGGFHRYATDARWFLPHFEKMLYDNAQLIRNYADAYALTGHENYRRTVAETFGWLQREMIDERGGFYSAIDADSEGEEGKFYVWTHEEILDVLGEEDGELFADVYGITREGTYYEESTGHRTGANIPYLPRPIGEAAEERGMTEDQLRDRLDGMKDRLLAVRDQRVHPHLDDKVISSWNGLMIAALADAGHRFAESAYTEAAARAADFILEHMEKDGRLLRTWRNGEAKQPAYLDDHAFLIDGLLELHKTTGDQRWLEEARALADAAIEHFHDDRDGGFYSTSDEHDELLLRAKELGGGGNMPSDNGVMAQALLRLTVLTGEKRYARAAVDTLHHFRGMMIANPRGSETLLTALADFYEAKDAGDLPKIEMPGGGVDSDADAVVSKPPLTLEAFASHDEVAPGQTIHVAVRIRIDDGYHIYGNEVDPSQLRPTTLKLNAGDAAALGEVVYPETEKVTDPVLGEEIAMYGGTITILAPVKVSPVARGDEVTLNFEVEAQACDDRVCLAPERYTLNVPIAIGPGADGEPRHTGIFEELGVE